jgi:signal transduction histidine kinase
MATAAMRESRPGPGHIGRRGVALGVVALLGALLAGATLWMAWGPSHLADAVPHLVAGVAALASGVYATHTVRWSRVGPLLVVMGFLWFAGDLVTCLNIEPLSHRCLDPGPVGELLGRLPWLWLGVLGHVLLTFPAGRIGNAQEGVLVGAVYMLALAMPVQTNATTGLMALLIASGPLFGWLRAVGPDRADRLPALLAGFGVAASLLMREVVPVQILELAVTLVSIGLVAGLVEITTRRATLTPDRAVGLRDELATALDDPALRVAYRALDRDAWVDRDGRPTIAPGGTDDLTVTTLERDGVLIAAVTHDPATLADPEVRQAVLTAVELAAHNARLAAQLEAQVTQVGASRRRLIDATLRERRELGALVDRDVDRPLDGLATELVAIGGSPIGDGARLHLDLATSHLQRVRLEVRDLAAGLYPRALVDSGLAGALHELAGRSTIPLTVNVQDDLTGGMAVDATVYFLCAEALANSTRHASGGRVDISVVLTEDGISVVVQDNGPGGVDETRGTGLRGLRDRIEALGGSLSIESRPNMGTRLAATIPVSLEARREA